MENELKKIGLDLLYQFIRAGIITEEDYSKAFADEHWNIGSNVQNVQNKEKIVNYLNGVLSVSNSGLSNWCKHNQVKCRSYKTLERCLRLGKFSYRIRRGNRYFYVKNGVTPDITEEDIIL